MIFCDSLAVRLNYHLYHSGNCQISRVFPSATWHGYFFYESMRVGKILKIAVASFAFRAIF